ncbi:hypothetical protein M501DRAFT_1020229 [Patellaria atrata CBS 101060]|uniref:Uncharacterized protein n=1 Tax=Patellaria atrata CBS 101060 TaxID=1346257 RepID=A0A9P4VJB9_9PEZI|nr:hypothetical protein M501DRAFT_1020229 [Patellaria atrata CBS 101060]
MPPVRPQVSITLPRNFVYHYTDGQPPKTPEPEEPRQLLEPPQPPRQTYRIRRRKQPFTTTFTQSLEQKFENQDVPLPTIETTESAPMGHDKNPPTSGAPLEGYLAPNGPSGRLMSPPKTPLNQMMVNSDLGHRLGSTWEDLRYENFHDENTRPSSSCSGISDSSISSCGSFDSFPSFGGSCTSPESEEVDPFTFPSCSDKMISSPLQGYEQRLSKRLRVQKPEVWTEDLDNHLWLTYMVYLQDATVTPFKMLPGTAPPLGVCRRVAREAKRTWKGGRASATVLGRKAPRSQLSSRAESPDTIKAAKSGSTTPTGPNTSKVYGQWPRSSSATRKRLRELCKQKPSLSAHYQRLLHTRSPSPFQSSPRARLKSRRIRFTSPLATSDALSSFSTRDMNISLAASTSSTMQAGNPLSRLVTEDQTPFTDEWFGQPVTGRISTHQKSQSLHLGLGLANSNTLGSPFTQNFHLPSISMNSEQSAQSVPQTGTAPPALQSPIELHAPRPLPRSFKRRAQHHLEDRRSQVRPTGGSEFLQELFGAPADTSHRRVRSRGFSLGDMGEGARRLSALITTQSAHEQLNQLPQPDPTQALSGLMPPPIDPVNRLGSPFGGASSNCAKQAL